MNGINPTTMQKIYNRYAPLISERNPYEAIIIRMLKIVALISAVMIIWNLLLRKKVREAVALNLAQANIVLQKSKQAEIGNLIANISHQWREPLSKLSSINLLTIAKLKAGESIDTATLLKQSDEIENTIDFMSHTMQNFLEFYKKSDIAAPFSLIESIHGVLLIIETKLLDNTINVQIEGDEEIVISGIKNEWMQVWLNLINNSIEILKKRDITNPTIFITVTNQAVTLCDNGGGMDLDAENYGLGLQMCLDITTKYHASFELSNNVSGLCVQIGVETKQ